METQIKIPVKNKKYIYGLLRGSLKSPLIIFVHGLTGNCNEHIFFNGARFFEEKGYSSFCFNLYDYPSDARKLEETTLNIHGQDLNTLTDYFKAKGIKKFFVIGHSWGAPTILVSKKEEIGGIVFWEPAFEISEIISEMKYSKALDAYLLNWQYRVVVGKKMIEEARNVNIIKLLKEIKVPIKFIYAAEGVLNDKGGKIFFPAANQPKELSIIKAANHTFDQNGVEEKLFSETLKWFKKIEP